jgi:hypothetical protein
LNKWYESNCIGNWNSYIDDSRSDVSNPYYLRNTTLLNNNQGSTLVCQKKVKHMI